MAPCGAIASTFSIFIAQYQLAERSGRFSPRDSKMLRQLASETRRGQSSTHHDVEFLIWTEEKSDLL